MKRYYLKETTPLKYHKFTRWVGLPLGILANLASVFTVMSEVERLNWAYAIDLGYGALVLALGLTAFIGFFRWTRASWYAVMGMQAGTILYYFIVLLVTAHYTPDGIASALGTLLGGGIVSALIMVYYTKRRPLFFRETVPAAGMPDAAHTPIRFCRKCGERLAEGGRFCCRCGADSREENAAEPAPADVTAVKKKSSRKWLVVSIFAVLILIGVLRAVLTGTDDPAVAANTLQNLLEKEPEMIRLEEWGERPALPEYADADQQAAYEALFAWVEENYNDVWDDGTVSYTDYVTDEDDGTTYSMDVWLYNGDELVLRCAAMDEDYLDIVYVTLYPDGETCLVEYTYYDPPEAEGYAFYGWADLNASELGLDGAIVFYDYETDGSEVYITEADFADYLDACADLAGILCEMAVEFGDHVLYDLASDGVYSMADFGFAG